MQILKQRVDTKRLFFALASSWAAIGPIIFVLNYFTILHLDLTVSDHGRSMLFGFTSALITGYLSGKRQLIEVIWLSSLWVATRLCDVLFTYDPLHLVMYGLFGLHLAYIVAPKFFAAKKIRNWLMSPTLAVIAIFPLVLLIASSSVSHRYQLFSIFTQLLSLLMFFMAGRMIPPLLVRANKRKGKSTAHRVQPTIEVAVMIGMALSIIVRLMDTLIGHFNVSVVLFIIHSSIALLILIRIFRWNPFELERQDYFIWGLLVGYLWLAIAQIAMAIEILSGQVTITSLHIVMVAGLGILSSTIMTLSVQKKASQTIQTNYVYCYIVLLSCAAMARYMATIFHEHHQLLLICSAMLWSANFILVCLAISKKRNPLLQRV